MQWLLAHPQYFENMLYVGGDSYSGIPLPMIVQEIFNGKVYSWCSVLQNEACLFLCVFVCVCETQVGLSLVLMQVTKLEHIRLWIWGYNFLFKNFNLICPMSLNYSVSIFFFFNKRIIMPNDLLSIWGSKGRWNFLILMSCVFNLYSN